MQDPNDKLQQTYNLLLEHLKYITFILKAQIEYKGLVTMAIHIDSSKLNLIPLIAERWKGPIHVIVYTQEENIIKVHNYFKLIEKHVKYWIHKKEVGISNKKTEIFKNFL